MRDKKVKKETGLDMTDVKMLRNGDLRGGGVARPARLELATLGFEVHYSVQLSYGRVNLFTP